MSRTVCSLLPGLDTRPLCHLHSRLPLKYPEYALSDRKRVTCVTRSYPSTTVKDASSSQQRLRNDSWRRGSCLDMCD
jgi:hypothetical protein